MHTNGTVNLLTAANLTKSVMAMASGTNSVPPETPSSSTGAKSPDAIPPVQIASVLITNAIIHLTDELAEPDARLTVNPLHIQLSGLSSTNLQSADIVTTGDIEPAGSFAVEAVIRPLDGPETTRLDVKTSGIDLTPTGPYVQRFLGYELDRGTASTQLEYQVTQRQLRGKNHVVLNQLTLGQAVESPDAIKAPIKLGIKVLQDRQGRIELQVPIQGSLDDPQFDIAGVVSRAFASVLTKVITSPFSVLGGLLGEGNTDDLERIQFAPGSSILDKTALSRVDKLEKVLFERPALGVELLGSVDPSKDGAALKAARLQDQLRTQASPQADLSLPLSKSDEDRLITEAYLQTHELPSTSNPPPETPAIDEQPATMPTAGTNDKKTNIHLSNILRGGERMMLRRISGTKPTALTPTASDTGATEPQTTSADVEPEPQLPAELPSPEVMRQALLDDIVISDADLAGLYEQRTQALRNALIQSGRIDSARITTRELTGDPPTGMEVRLTLR
jgi:hypothetical protein